MKLTQSLSIVAFSGLFMACHGERVEGLTSVAAPRPAQEASTPRGAPESTLVSAPTSATDEVLDGTDSIYGLEVRLTDQNAAVRSIDAFRGHPVLVTMFYGRCPAACPLLTSDLKRIERQLPATVRSNVRVLMVSFDPARDTPVELSRLMKERGMDATRWTLASASDDHARELAGVLGIRYRKLDNGEFFHSSSIVLLDALGRPRARMDGVGGEVNTIVAALEGFSG